MKEKNNHAQRPTPRPRAEPAPAARALAGSGSYEMIMAQTKYRAMQGGQKQANAPGVIITSQRNMRDQM
jgi:hypothetical protein